MSDRRPAIRTSAVATGRGDDGTTGLLYGSGRVGKDDPRTEACGTVDEAVAALGLARGELVERSRHGVLPPAMAGMAALVLRVQRELFVAGAELAAGSGSGDRLEDGRTRVSEWMVQGLESILSELESAVALPREFIVPGETRIAAALDLARTIVRRAERRAVTLQRSGLASGLWLVPYLNRLSDLLWILARTAEAADSRDATLARSGTPGSNGISAGNDVSPGDKESAGDSVSTPDGVHAVPGRRGRRVSETGS